MAKPKLFDRLFEAGIRSFLIQIFNFVWPWTFFVLTGIAQLLDPVPWPYFFAVLGVVAFLTVIGIAQFSDWRARRRIDNKITVNLQSVFQYPIEGDPGKCGYRLMFRIFSTHTAPLSMCVNSLKWDLSDKSADASDVLETQAMLPPGSTSLWSSTIAGLSPDAHKGAFNIKLAIGTEFEKKEFEFQETGSFKISAQTNAAIEANLPFSSKILKITVAE